MRQLRLIAALALVGLVTGPAVAEQSLGDIAKKTEEARAKKAADEAQRAAPSSTSTPACAALLQHPLAWWLGSQPTSAERDQLAACVGGNSSQPVATTTSGLATSSASSSDKPARWNLMNPSEQATWYRLAPKTWSQMTEQEHIDWARILSGPPAPAIVVPAVSNDAAYQRYLRTKLRSTESGKQPVRHFTETEWETYCAGHRSDEGTCRGWMPGADATAPTSLNANWTEAACATARQSLSLLSSRIDETIAQLRVLAPPPRSGAVAQPPSTYRCTSDRLGTETTTTCEPGLVYKDPGAAFSEAFSNSIDRSLFERRYKALAAQIQTLQTQFDRTLREQRAHCGAR